MTLIQIPRKIVDAVTDAKLLSESLLQKCAIDPEGTEVYKDTLRCRSDVQYAIALIRIEFGLLAMNRPQLKGRVSLDVNLAKIKDLLSRCVQSMESQKLTDAFEDLLAADAVLGKLIGSMRRKNRSSCFSD